MLSLSQRMTVNIVCGIALALILKGFRTQYPADYCLWLDITLSATTNMRKWPKNSNS